MTPEPHEKVRWIGALLLSESNINQQLLATHVYNVTKCAFSAAAEVKRNAALSDAQVADA